MAVNNNACSSVGSSEGGFTLIELMVAVTLSLFLLSGVAVLYLNTYAIQRDSALTANLEHNARTALTVIARDLRSAGYNSGLNMGSIDGRGLVLNEDCGGLGSALQTSPFFMAGIPDPDKATTVNNILDCVRGSIGNYNAADGSPSDWFLIKGAFGDRIEVNELEANTNYLVANSQEGRLFRGNNPPVISDDQEIREYHYNLFYLRDNQLMLSRLVGGQLEELTIALGVEALRVVLGIDDNGDGRVNRYEGVSDAMDGWSEVQWNRVRSVKIHLLSHSASSPNHEDHRSYQMSDISILPDGDDRKRSLASTTVFLYNQDFR
ncbi:PilW family protein [Endozoicomonas atrinae]|uniref:PilW family protein n=1 Tax=Endozoicomonas atrinae TaxID=1333660 RepID=UPI000825CDAC|nr:PilW family protein [Endozoicomonas atrinae]